MNNKLILDLTVRLTQALDQNYDVVNMDTVLAVISALEGATITKEQLETTRLAKHINQLRRRNKSNILAIRAKNLLKKWREMVGITSQAQTEGASSATQQSQPTQQQVPKPSLSSTSQPASPYTAQLLGENFDNSLSSIGGGVEFIKTAIGSVSNTGSANCNINKKSITGIAGGETEEGVASSRSNGALTDAQVRVSKSKHPTSFKNLITGFNATNQVTSKLTALSPLSPLLKVQPPTGESAGEMLDPNVKTNLTTYVINDDGNHSQPSTTTRVAKTGPTSPRTLKSTKIIERDSPLVMAFMENSSSPLGFDKSGRGSGSQMLHSNDVNHTITSIIDLQDSNSSSNFVNSLCEVAGINKTIISQNEGTASNSKKRTRKDKKRPNNMDELFAEAEHFRPTIDESSRIAFPISGIQEYLSLSNSSMSIFPTQQTAGLAEAERHLTIAGPNHDDQPLNSSIERNSEVADADLTFAGKFKQTNNSSSGIEVGSSSNYYSNGGRENMSATSSEFPCGNMKVAMNNCRDSVNRTASSPIFLRFSRNSNDSSSNSRTSQLDVIDVVNQDSQSMITVDDLRQQQQSSNEKNNTQKEVEPVNDQTMKPAKDNSTPTSKQYAKEQTKFNALQKPATSSSKPSTPTNVLNAIVPNAVPSPPIEQKIPKKRGRKKGSKGVDSVLAQSAALSSQFLIGPAFGSSKKVKTTKELLADIQNRKLGSATSSPTLMNWFGTSRPASSCSEPSLHSPRTSDACSTNATMSTAARSTPEKNISNNSVAADELYESDSDSNTSEPSHDSFRIPIISSLVKSSQLKSLPNDSVVTEQTVPTPSIEEQIKEIMALLPPVEEVDMEAYEDIPCTCSLREIPPEVVEPNPPINEMNDNGLDLPEIVPGDDEPIISVSVLPLVLEKPPSKKVWSPNAPHSQSAPVSAVTSPVVPSTNPKPMKSIFDLDFDDDNDPLHNFVEATSKTTKSTESPPNYENGRTANEEKPMTKSKIVQCKDDSEVAISQQMQSELTQPTASPEPPPPVQLPPQLQGANDITMPSFFNFPTYEVVEDPECQAYMRYELETNQITKFHINAFHNCFIPNVNGNWDHSVPQNIDGDCHYLENGSLYSNVVPKYGCFFTERIPKDLSHVKFTKDFKPKNTKNSIKSLQPFLGVANIDRFQHFRLRHHRKLNHKRTTTKKRKQSKKRKSKIEHKLREKKTRIEVEVCKTLDILDVKTPSDIPGQIADKSNEPQTIASDVKEENEETKPLSPKNSSVLPVTNHDINKEPISRDDQQKGKAKADESLCDFVEYSVISYRNDAKKPTANGNFHHLMNNNSIVHCADETKSEGPKLNLNNILLGGVAESLYSIAASRRSSSCSNSSLKQNQNSINMKLRMHRLQQQEKQRQRRKRKHLSSFTNVMEFGKDESAERLKVPPLIKRIKIVNGEYEPSAKRLTNINNDSNCLDDDGDSDCYHVHSENDIITEEEIDEDCDDLVIRDGDGGDEYEDLPDDFDEEDGDDEEDAEEDYGDFHEVVTRDMTSSTTGNNHIVLTIKKTPSKTNSPSSSSMSPAPVLYANTAKLPSNNATVESSLSYLLEDNATELPTKNELPYEENDKSKLENIIELANKANKSGLFNKFFWSEPPQVTVLNFQVKKNGDDDLENNDNDGEGDEERQDENDAREEENNITVSPEDESDKKKDENDTLVSEMSENKKITKAELNESLQTANKRVRRLELKTRLRQGIEEARKLHRELFFPYELHTSIGSKILEISSCTSDCTDSSEDETGSSDDDTTSSSSSSGTDGIKSRVLLKRRRRAKVPPKKSKAAGGGGGPPSSSSSSSSSDSSSSSSNSYSSWGTTSSSASDSEDKKPVVKKEGSTEETASPENKDEKKQEERELPAENNFLLRSFNHIYVSTEERRRQQQLKQAAERHQHEEIVNTGYITLSGDDSKEGDETPSVSQLPVPRDNCEAYINYYNYNQNRKLYNKSNSGCSISSSNNTTTINSITDTLYVIQPSTSQTIIPTSVAEEQPTETTNAESPSTLTSSNETLAKILTAESSSIEETKTNDNSNIRINADSSIGSNNNYNQSSVQLNENTEQEELIPQEEYRTGLRKVDEDVDDEDGNNCARTQQFKEWHEVLQLRSYNDELLTVLPYVVIE